MSTDELAWVPESCTLPTAQQPLRVAEFDELFAESLRHQQRVSPTRLRWVLDSGADARVRDLISQETACCSFFSFTVTPSSRGVMIETEVPEAHVEVLDGLQERAAGSLS